MVDRFGFRPLAGISGLRTLPRVEGFNRCYFGFRPLAGISGLRTKGFEVFDVVVKGGFRPLAGISGLRTEKMGWFYDSQLGVSVPLRGLVVFGLETRAQAQRRLVGFPSPCGD